MDARTILNGDARARAPALSQSKIHFRTIGVREAATPLKVRTMNSTRKRLTLAMPASNHRPNSEVSRAQSATELESDLPEEALERAPAGVRDYIHDQLIPTSGYLKVPGVACSLEPESPCGNLKIDFENGSVVKRLAKRLKNAVMRSGGSIPYTRSLDIVARMFGHDNYEAMHGRFELANPSQSDAEVSPEERSRRHRQYVFVLAQNNFSVDDAERLVDAVRVGPWFDFQEQWTQSALTAPSIRPADNAIEFLDLRTTSELFSVFKRAFKAHGLKVEKGPKHLFAKLFGHESFGRLQDAAGRGSPSIPDFYLSPAALDQRVMEYLVVLADAGIDQAVGLSLLRDGYGGWLGIEELEWESLRLSWRVHRIENGYRPRWRPRPLGGLS